MTAHIAWMLCAVGIAVTWLQLRAVSAGLAEARKEVSRYRLYEARDDLMRLVAEGGMDEDDKSWRIAYASVNNLLSIHERLDLWSVVRGFDKFMQAMASDHELRREVELHDRSLNRTSREVPQFKAALVEMSAGFEYAMMRQTSFWSFLAAAAFIKIRRFLARPKTPGELSTWSRHCCST